MVDDEQPGNEPENKEADVSAELPSGDDVKSKSLDAILANSETAKAGTDTPSKEPEKAAKPKEDRGPKWYREGIERANREAAEARRKVEEMERRLQQGQQPQPQHLDPLASPEQFTQSFEARLQSMQLAQTLQMSERFAKREFGQELFEDTRSWLTTRPDIEAWAVQQSDPWDAAIRLFQKEQLAEEIGTDPNAWREKERERLRAEIQAEFQSQQPVTSMRPGIPAPASASRSAGPRQSSTGPTALASIIGNR